MAKTALKERLEEKLYQNEVIETEIVEEQNNIVPFMKPEQQLCSIVPEFAITLIEAKERIKMLQEFVGQMMVEGIDYGTIPKCDKPTLFKSGAEKLTDIFGFSKKLEITNRLENWEDGIFHYEVKVILISKRTGLVEAEGIGCCNNREKKYINQHAFSVINTVLKMAKKRALVDAVLSATRSSSLFTQDIEDMDQQDAYGNNLEQVARNETNINYRNKSSQSTSYESTSNPVCSQNLNNSANFTNSPYQNSSNSTANIKLVTKSQLNKIQALVNEKNIPVNRIKLMMKERYQVDESKNLVLKQADDFIKHLINNF